MSPVELSPAAPSRAEMKVYLQSIADNGGIVSESPDAPPSFIARSAIKCGLIYSSVGSAWGDDIDTYVLTCAGWRFIGIEPSVPQKIAEFFSRFFTR